MGATKNTPPDYRRYRSGTNPFAGPGREAIPDPREIRAAGKAQGTMGGRRRPRVTFWRVVGAFFGLIVFWIALSAVLFLISSHFERTPLPGNVSAVLDPSGFPLTSANNILVIGSDRRPKNSKEPGAETTGYGRSDTIMLIRTGGGHAARLSIPRDTVVEIPGHGLQKINAAHEYGGPAESVSVIKHWLGVPINHVVEVNFENFPQLIDSMGGVSYTGGCVFSQVDGGAARGGITLRLPAGTHTLDGREALALARTRENKCARGQDDIQREEHQQALFNAMKAQLLTFGSFVRLPLISWNAPPAIISDMTGPELLGMFTSLAVTGTPPTRVLLPTGTVTLPTGEEGLTITNGAKARDFARFMAG